MLASRVADGTVMPAGSPNGVAKSCNVSGSVLSDNAARNACESGGTAYTCMKQAPWKVSDNLSYGFAASHTNGDCGKCFELSFNNGKKLVVMISNIGGDVANGQFDLMIPGGGVGAFNALSTQIQQNGGNSSNLGAQYGGFRSQCANNGDIKGCVRNMCSATFGSAALADLKAGCDWYVDWFDAADNPQANSASVTCPQALIDKYKGNFNSNPTPTPTPGSSASGGGSSSNSGNNSSACGSTAVTVGTETTKVEAECYASKSGANMVTSTANGITNIGYIENGYSTTYKVSVPSGRAGQYTLQFRIASEAQSNFTVEVNGANTGRISGNTGNWDTYTTVSLASKAQFNTGENTIVLKFESAVNVDYFLIVGTLPSSSSVRISSSSSAFSSSSSPSPSPSSSSSLETVPIRLPQIASDNHVVQIGNGISLAVKSSAVVGIYGLKGNLIQKQNFASGVYSISFGHLPKGMYIAKVKFGSETRLLRVPVM